MTDKQIIMTKKFHELEIEINKASVLRKATTENRQEYDVIREELRKAQTKRGEVENTGIASETAELAMYHLVLPRDLRGD